MSSMENSSLQTTSSVIEDDEWDNDGFVIPSFEIEEDDESKHDPKVEDTKQSLVQESKEDNIYLGPHGAPPSQSKQEQNSSNRKQKLKQKLRDADKRNINSGRENKVDNLRELVGVGRRSVNTAKSSPRDWLDPHCHESEFERKHS
ncbi:hypothetical protein LIER_41453 [Lithospermum erythrorhizon]|uniref:Uncharacterized protein n=1 Tax=Lithospermum erythrorhizon TaxID=34254 RepID=A0AAV3RCK4_LITER